MIAVSNMTTNNPALILGAILINVVCWVARLVVALIEWAAVGLLGLGRRYGRPLAMVAMLVVVVVLVAVFWQVVAAVAASAGIMYGGLMAIKP